MKIVIFSPYFHPHKGGVEQFCWQTSTRLAKLGHKVFVISSKIDTEKKNEAVDGINIVRLDTYDLIGGTYPIPKYNRDNTNLLKQVFAEKVSAVITNTRFFPISLYGLWMAKKYHVKSFHIEHGTCHPKLSNSLTSFIALLYDQSFGRIIFRMADNNLAISKAAASFSESLGAKNNGIIYNSVDTDFFKPFIKKTYNETIPIIYVGRLIQSKGVQDLINAFKQVRNKKIRLTIVGTGNYEKTLKELAYDDERIKFLGEKNKEEIRKLLSESVIFVNPSYAEGLPTSVLEAGAMGLAVIATNVGGTKEIITNKLNGFLIEPGDSYSLVDKLMTLIKAVSIRDKYSKKLFEIVKKKFSWNLNILKLANYLLDSNADK